MKVELAGTPATVLITEPFQTVVASNAVKLGAPGYHFLVVPHPVWGKDDEELRGLVSRIADAAVRQLVSDTSRAGEARSASGVSDTA